MKIRTYLLISYLIILGILAAGMLAIADMTLCSLSCTSLRAAHEGVVKLNQLNYELSRKILTTYAQRLVEAKAEETATTLSTMLAGRKSYDYDQMRGDPELKRVAAQYMETWDGGVAGYLTLSDKKGISILHPDGSVQGEDLIQWKKEYPEFWKLVEGSFTKRKVKGYYTFIDKENRPRRRYQVRVWVPGTPFVAVAIVNIDEYFTPVQEKMKNAGLNAEALVQKSIEHATESSRQKMVLFASAGVLCLLLLAGLFGIGFARAVSRPIVGLRDGVRSIGSGDLEFQVPEKGAKEVRDLARSFNELGSRLSSYIERRDFVRDTFGRYMTKEIADKLLESEDALVLGGEAREITILMSDVRGFSALSADMRPDVLIDILNVYLSRMIDTLLEFEGVVNEIIGDGILAFFGAPVEMEDHSARAVACALKMQRAIEEVNAQNKERGYPILEMGIAVVTGNVVVGNIGSDKRCKYGAVGADVNLAGRVESLALGGQVLINRSTYEKVADQVIIRDSFSVEMKGLPNPVEVYDVVGISGTYGIQLNTVEEEAVELRTPVPALLQRLSEKVVHHEETDVTIRSISLSSTVFSCPSDLAPRDDVKCTLVSHQTGDLIGELYAKIASVKQSDGMNLVTARFTSLSSGAEDFIRKLCGSAEADSRVRANKGHWVRGTGKESRKPVFQSP